MASMLWSDPDSSWFRIANASAIMVARSALTSAPARFSMTRRRACQRVHWIPETSIGRPLGIVPGFVQAWRILHSEAPELIVSAGSGSAIPFFLAARVLGIPTFWISTLNVVTTPGISAKICARLSSRVFLQQPSMLGAHPDGFVIGELY